MVYNVPGRADIIPEALVNQWNSRIRAEFDRLSPGLGSRFFSIDPATVDATTPTVISWFGDPAEPAFCQNPTVARELSDWGVRGRHALHNEYCEYAAIRAPDQNGKLRLKRIQVTTELREYWLTVARSDPDTLKVIASDVLGREPSWSELYGVADPFALNARGREVAFAKQNAGHGNMSSFVTAGVPAQPVGSLNTENAMFMSHPINGLDDLIYIVMFGARPFFRKQGQQLVPATKEQIFRSEDVAHLACRHADPAAAIGAQAAAVQGRAVAFANPLGVYIHTFASDIFLLDGEPLPDEWIRFGRGADGMFQRLEVGPGDDEDAFLDQVTVAAGASDQPLVGGHQIVENIEVGPFVLVGPTSQVSPGERVVLDVDDSPVECAEAEVCDFITDLKAAFDAAAPVRDSPRRMRPVR